MANRSEVVFWQVLFGGCYEFRPSHPKCGCELQRSSQCRHVLATFNFANVAALQLGEVRQGLLCDAELRSSGANGGPESSRKDWIGSPGTTRPAKTDVARWHGHKRRSGSQLNPR